MNGTHQTTRRLGGAARPARTRIGKRPVRCRRLTAALARWHARHTRRHDALLSAIEALLENLHADISAAIEEPARAPCLIQSLPQVAYRLHQLGEQAAANPQSATDCAWMAPLRGLTTSATVLGCSTIHTPAMMLHPRLPELAAHVQEAITAVAGARTPTGQHAAALAHRGQAGSR
jgi:hypothetical protein